MRPAAVTDELQAQPWPRCQLHMGRSQLQSQMQSEAARRWLDDARQARNSGSVNAVLNAFLSAEDKAGLFRYSLLSKMPNYLYSRDVKCQLSALRKEIINGKNNVTLRKDSTNDLPVRQTTSLSSLSTSVTSEGPTSAPSTPTRRRDN